ncbi:MAG: hypothetical protein M1825_004511 [Sarcosagium campestre]|nr:MAG: hypothetical protein M1825_004511 [Sarcosagium campestre]
MPNVLPCLWFDTEGEEAAKFYTSIFPNSSITNVARYPAGSPRPQGTVMTVTFKLDGKEYIALNGGPDFKFNEAISLQIECPTQDEIDHYWTRLGEGGSHGPCGWLRDKFGLSWQVCPPVLDKLLADPDARLAGRVMAAMMKMGKIDIAELQRAADQE